MSHTIFSLKFPYGTVSFMNNIKKIFFFESHILLNDTKKYHSKKKTFFYDTLYNICYII